jgi:cytochrome c
VRWLAASALAASAVLILAGLDGGGTTPPSPADVAKGREIYERCAACHSLERDRVGPRHCGLFGRPAGSVPGFVYSDPMRGSGIVWDRATLDRFLADPLRTVPGTFMGYAGIPSAEERAQLLAYLEVATRGEQCDPATAARQP